MRLDRRVVAFEAKTVGAPDERAFEGYGSVFGVLDSYADIVAKGAFKRTLKEAKAKGRMPALLWQHDPRIPVGVYEEMREDDTGLYVKGQLADTQQGNDAYTLLKMGALSGLSIGFRTLKSKIDEESGIRTLTEVELWEVSLVTFPANDAARVAVVKADGELPTEREFETWLRREAGFTENQAKTIIAKGFRQVRREAMSSGEACGELLALVNQRAAIFTGEQTS
jgi:HK97 family phage prohead protease